MCAPCAATYWTDVGTRDTLCLDRSHGVPWEEVSRLLSRADLGRVKHAICERVFEGQGARFHQVAVNMEELGRKKRARDETSEIDAEITRLKAMKAVIMKKADSDVLALRSDSRAVKCPRTECQGTVMNDGRCFACRGLTCRKCACEVNGPIHDHTCNQNDRMSIDEIGATCRTCPSCAVPIYKIEGCNHMFCTHCKASYDVRSMRRMHNSFGNPHFDEYVSQLSGGLREDMMGDVLAHNDVSKNIFLWRYNDEIKHPMEMVIRTINMFVNQNMFGITRIMAGTQMDKMVSVLSREYVTNAMDRAKFIIMMEKRLAAVMVRERANSILHGFLVDIQAHLRSASMDPLNRVVTHDDHTFVMMLSVDRVRGVIETYRSAYNRVKGLNTECGHKGKNIMDLMQCTINDETKMHVSDEFGLNHDLSAPTRPTVVNRRRRVAVA
jgi:hypothetical protein